MALLEDLIGLGLAPELAAVQVANTVTASPTRSVSTALTAAGTTITDALQLVSFSNIISTAAASTGVKLNSSWPIGQIGLVQNNGANALNLFPPTSAMTINGGSAGAAVTIAAAAGNIVIRLSATDFAAYVVAKEA